MTLKPQIVDAHAIAEWEKAKERFWPRDDPEAERARQARDAERLRAAEEQDTAHRLYRAAQSLMDCPDASFRVLHDHNAHPDIVFVAIAVRGHLPFEMRVPKHLYDQHLMVSAIRQQLGTQH